MENDGHEEEQIQRITDHRFSKTGRCGDADQGSVPQGGLQRGRVLQVTRQVRRHGYVRRQATEGAGGENGKLKKLSAEAHLDMHALKSVFGVKR